MRRLTLIRFAVLIAVRDFLIPGGGLFLAIYLPVTDQLEPWHIPLITAMLGTPFISRGESPPELEKPSVAESGDER